MPVLFKPRSVMSRSLLSHKGQGTANFCFHLINLSLSLSPSSSLPVFNKSSMLIHDRAIMQTPRSPLITLSPSSPSFDSYSSGHNLADIATRVVNELSISDHHQPPPSTTTTFCSWNNENDYEAHEQEQEHQQDEEEEEEEFEFKFVYGPETDQTSPVSADDIFYNGKIMPVYPLFDTTLLHNNNMQISTESTATTDTPTKTVRLSLRKLFYQENLMSSSSFSSSSSLESDHQESFDGIEHLPPGTYCVWAPGKKGGEGKGDGHGKMKSNSTGSSKRWKLRDLLYRRSNSDGKETFVFLAPAGKRVNGSRPGRGAGGRGGACGDVEKETKGGGVKVKQSCEKTGEVKRHSYLPYRKELVGLFPTK